jgi:hypothetical protein
MHLLYCILEGVQLIPSRGLFEKDAKVHVSNESTNANVIVEAAGMMYVVMMIVCYDDVCDADSTWYLQLLCVMRHGQICLTTCIYVCMTVCSMYA